MQFTRLLMSLMFAYLIADTSAQVTFSSLTEHVLYFSQLKQPIMTHWFATVAAPSRTTLSKCVSVCRASMTTTTKPSAYTPYLSHFFGKIETPINFSSCVVDLAVAS